ncbi:MAG: YncE family protein, partial [Anaerolineae bacterium]
MSRRASIGLTVALGIGLVVLLVGVTGAWAEPAGRLRAPLAQPAVVSDTVSYQGRLVDNDGNPVDGTAVMTFSLYAAQSGGAYLWRDSFPVTVDEGLFNIHLDVDPDLFDGQALWLGVHVEGDAGEMTPRQPLLPAPYAFSLRPGATISGSLAGGTSSALGVVNSDASTSGGYAIRAINRSESTGRPAIYGENQGTSAGVYGRADGWHGVVGWNVSGQWAGVFGHNQGTGSGVYGENTSGAGAGVRGDSTDGFGVAGYSENDVAVYGEATHSTSGYFTSTHGVGVHAETPSGNAALLGESAGGPGVVGTSEAGPGGTFASESDHALETYSPSLIQGPNPMQIALLRWYPAIQTSIDFNVGFGPAGIAFDGANIWVTNYGDDTVSVLRANNGAHIMTPTVGARPAGIAFDGANMWVTNFGDDTVSVLRASDGAHVMILNAGDGPDEIAFDGANMWVTNYWDGTVSVLRARDGFHVMTPTVGTQPYGISFDGANMWVTNFGDGTVSVLRASDGAHVMTPTVGTEPYGIAFDGANMWVANYGDDTVSVLRANNGAHIMTPTVGACPAGIAFDGANMWVTNLADDTVSVLRASDGAHA